MFKKIIKYSKIAKAWFLPAAVLIMILMAAAFWNKPGSEMLLVSILLTALLFLMYLLFDLRGKMKLRTQKGYRKNLSAG